MSELKSKSAACHAANNFDPFEILKTPCDTWPDDPSPVWTAISVFDPDHPGPLLELLEGDDPHIATWGLFVFDELGRRGHAVVDAALRWVDHPRDRTRSYVAGGVLSFTRRLTPRQVNLMLHLTEDRHPLVRAKMASLFRCVKLETLQAAIELVECPERRARHEVGLAELAKPVRDVQRQFVRALNDPHWLAAYRYAALEKAAARVQNILIPEYSGDDSTAHWTRINMRWLSNRRWHQVERRRDPDGYPAKARARRKADQARE